MSAAVSVGIMASAAMTSTRATSVVVHPPIQRLQRQPARRVAGNERMKAPASDAHWAKRGRPRETSDPLEPSPLQLELDTTGR
jgi:hypothetical protein